MLMYKLCKQSKSILYICTCIFFTEINLDCFLFFFWGGGWVGGLTSCPYQTVGVAFLGGLALDWAVVIKVDPWSRLLQIVKQISQPIGRVGTLLMLRNGTRTVT